MMLSPAARAAAKQAQLARLKHKGTPEYPALFASQPEQVRKAEENRIARKKLHDEKNAGSITAISEASGAVAVFGGDGKKAKKGEK